MLNDLKEFVMIFVRFFVGADKLTCAAIGVGLLIAFLYFRIFFRDASGFVGDVYKAGQIPMVHANYDRVESKWADQKVMIWILLSVGSGVLAYYQLPEWFPSLLGRGHGQGR